MAPSIERPTLDFDSGHGLSEATVWGPIPFPSAPSPPLSLINKQTNK